MKSKKILFITNAAVIAALYIIINYLQELIVPTSSSMIIQFRIAEALCILAVFSKAAIPGLTIGTFIANIINIGTIPLDLLFGTLATLIAVILIYILRNIKWFNLPILSALMPAIINGIIIGSEFVFFLPKDSYPNGNIFIFMRLVAIGEFVVLFVLGLPLYKIVDKNNKIKEALS